MSRIIVTGGAGRLGRSVIEQLVSNGDEVFSADRALSDTLAVEQVEVDLTDAAATQTAFARVRPDAIVQLAAIAVPFSAPEDRILATNAVLAYNALRAGYESGARRFVVASSPTVIGYGAPTGWLPSSFPLDENEPPRPWNAYALSKLLAEQVMRMFVAERGPSFRAAAFRPCYVISPEEWAGGPTQQGHTVLERLDDPKLSAPALFNYVDARDAASFVSQLLDNLDDIAPGETFFVGSADALARRPLAELLPLFVPGSGELASGLTGTSPAFSIEKATSLIGWTPVRSWRTELQDPMESSA